MTVELPYLKPRAYHKVIITCGVSLFSYASLFGRINREKGLITQRHTGLNLPADTAREVFLCNWLSQMRQLIHQSEANEQIISAEYSLLRALRNEGSLQPDAEVRLFYTSTLSGTAAAMLLKMIIEQDFDVKVFLSEVRDFNVKDRVQLNRSLGNFMQMLGTELRPNADQPYFICFAPIGGYKVMTSVAYMAGSIFGIPSAYLHEDEQVLHFIPPLPVRFDRDFVETQYELIRSLHSIPAEFDKLKNSQQRTIMQNPFFFETAGNLVMLNPFGYFICELPEFAGRFNTRICLSTEARGKINDRYFSAKGFAYQQLRIMLAKVFANQANPNEFKADLHHEADFSVKWHDPIFYLYKGASGGRHIFRAAWRFLPKEGRLEINNLWLTKPYEDDILIGKGLLADFGDYLDLSSEIYRIGGSE